jgi:hypothetical protein
MSNSLESNSGATQGGFNVPDIYSLANSKDPALLSRGLYRKKTSSIYGSASFGYKKFLFVDVTGRNDWSSTLPTDNWSYFYPSITSSFIFSKFIKSDALSFGKIRIGWAQVGNDTGAYRLYNTYVQGTSIGGEPTFYLPSILNNAHLKPEITTSFETGLTLNFFNSRFGLDFTYYNGETENQIIPIKVSPTTGYNNKWVNAGKMKNSGIELSLNARIFDKKDGFKWNVVANWATNTNEVVELADGMKSYVMSYFYPGVTLESRVGEPFSSIYARKVKRAPDGQMIVDADGYYVNGDVEFIGSVLPDWTAGVSNSLSYKNFSLSALIDIQKGGVFFARGYQTAIYAGTIGLTAANGVRENGVVAEGVMQNGTDANGNPVYVTNTTPAASYKHYFRLMRRNPGDFTVFDASFVKLREVSLKYNIPSKFVEKILLKKASVSLYGTNLAILYRNTPQGYDPESAGNSAGNIQGREYGQLPRARTFGLRLNMSL